MADIRSFFAPSKRKPTAAGSSDRPSSTATAPSAAKPAPKKRKAIISSDEEEDDPKAAKIASNNFSPKPNLKKLKKTTDDVDTKTKAARGKPVDVSSAFGSEIITRVERPKSKSKKADADELAAHFDEAFDDSLADIDSSLLESESLPVAVTTSAKTTKTSKSSPSKSNGTKSKNSVMKASPAKSNGMKHKEPTMKESPAKTNAMKSAEPTMKVSPDKSKPTIKGITSVKPESHHSNGHGHGIQSSRLTVEQEPAGVKADVSSPVKIKAPPTSAKKTPKSRKRSAEKADTMNESVQTDEERFEKKRMAAAMYQQFKNRGGPPNPGSKELPKGKPTCLASLTFILTGVLDSMERDEAADLIRAHGGKVTTSLSKKTSYMVAGEDAGLAKLAKADELKTTVLTEDDLLNLIRKKSGLPLMQATAMEPPKSSPPLSVKKEVKLSPKKTPPANGHAVKKEIMTPTSTATDPMSVARVKIEKTDELLQAHRVETEHDRNIASVDNQAWVDKYRPTSVKQIIGQQGQTSNVAKLTNWLTKWYVNQHGAKKSARPNPWAKNDDGAFFKAALLSGPPGVGKTTTATLVSRELGFDVVEFNASDTRSKRLLKEEVSELLSNKSLYGYFRGTKDAVTVKHVLLMDEVDGMAGNEDRGGLQELIALIRDSSVPVICMCNDRNHQKMRSLVNHCYDLRFARPQIGQIKGAMMSICFKEGVKLPPGVLEEIIAATNNDIRQTLNHLTLMSAGEEAAAALKASQPAGQEAPKEQQTAKKDMKLGPWEVVRKVFSADEHKTMSLADKADLFFHDYSLGPLFVQQNYLQVVPRVPKAEIIQRVALAADSLSRGDLVESRIRSKMAWSMLPVQAMFSSVLPGEYMSGHIGGQINFPGWLGKHSKSSKRSRMAQEIHDHTRIRTSGSRQSVRLDYAGFLLDAIARPMREHGSDGVEASLAVMKEYQLLREDIDSLLELSTWPGQKTAFDGIDGRVKAALTRTYNKDVAPYSFSGAAAVKKKKADSADAAAEEGGNVDAYAEGEGTTAVVSDEEEEEDTNVENDVLIKAKKKPAATKAPKGKASSSTSAKTTGGSGRAKATKVK